MHEFDSTKTYRLVDVRDHDGNSKAETKDLYKARIPRLTSASWQPYGPQKAGYKAERFSVGP